MTAWQTSPVSYPALYWMAKSETLVAQGSQTQVTMFVSAERPRTAYAVARVVFPTPPLPMKKEIWHTHVL